MYSRILCLNHIEMLSIESFPNISKITVIEGAQLSWVFLEDIFGKTCGGYISFQTVDQCACACV